MEAVIRHENDGGAVAGFLHQGSQHLIVELVRHRDHVVVQLEVALPDPRLPGWMVLHKPVAEVIDCVIVDGEEIPRLVVDQPQRGGLHAPAFRERPQEQRQALVVVLIDLPGKRNKRLHHLRHHEVGMHAQTGERLS